MFRIALKGLAARKRRLLGTALAVFLGVAFLSGTLALGDTLRANFDELFTDATAGTDAVVRSSTEIEASSDRGPDDRRRGTIDAALVDRVAAVDGVAAAEPAIEGYGQIIGADGDAVGGNGPPRRASNWIDNSELNPYRLVEGRAPRRSGEVVINRGAAEDGGLAVGDTTIVQTPDPVRVRIVGIATFGTADGFGEVTYAGFTLADAQRYLAAGPSKVSGVVVDAEAGVTQADLVERLQPVVPDGVEVLTGQELADENITDINEQFLNLLTTFLVVFAGIALVVATFSISNTFSILVAQRSREAALLRAVGASRRQIVSSVLFETLGVAVIASIVGLAGGLGLAGLLKGMFDAFGFALPDGGLVYSGGTVATALIVGVTVTLLAGLAPALKASQVPPVAALRDVALDRSSASKARRVIGWTAAALGGAAVAASAASDDGAGLAGLGVALLLVAVVALGPVAARPVGSVLGWPAARMRGIVGALARQNAVRNPRRTAGSAIALVVGVGVVTMLTVFAASFSAAVERSVDRSFAGDLVVRSPSFGGTQLSPRIASAVADVPEVERTVGLGDGVARVGGDDSQLTVAEPADLAALVDVGSIQGSLENAELAVSADEAESNGWSIGDVVPMAFADGARQSFTISAVYEEDDLLGDFVLSRDAWVPHGVQDADRLVLIGLRDGVSIADGKAAIEKAVDPFGSPDVQDREEFVAASAAALDTLLGIVYVLLALAIVIALMGIANTLSLAVHERRRELGLLRAVGTTRAQVRSLVRWEAAITALFGVTGGLGLGLVAGWAVVGAAGNGVTFTLPAGRLVVVVIVGAVAGVLASLRPARRAARLDVVDALATA